MGQSGRVSVTAYNQHFVGWACSPSFVRFRNALKILSLNRTNLLETL